MVSISFEECLFIVIVTVSQHMHVSARNTVIKNM